MIKTNNIEVWGFEHAIRGMRNPKNSWNLSDSTFGRGSRLGERDVDLMKRLYHAGSEHRKYLRQIMISLDITAPLYWWKEFDTYKVGVTSDSCSTMHKIQAKEFVLNDFSHECLNDDSKLQLNETIILLNKYRDKFLETKNKSDWWQMIQLLPTSYNQKRTITMSYENAVSMIHQRSGHKLDEWRNFVEILKSLPHMKEIINEENNLINSNVTDS